MNDINNEQKNFLGFAEPLAGSKLNYALSQTKVKPNASVNDVIELFVKNYFDNGGTDKLLSSEGGATAKRVRLLFEYIPEQNDAQFILEFSDADNERLAAIKQGV